MQASLQNSFQTLAVCLLTAALHAQTNPTAAAPGPAGIDFVRIPAGQFTLGSEDDRSLRADHEFSIEYNINDERPDIRVEITKPFDMSRTEVTVGQFKQFVQATRYKTDAERGQGAFVFKPDADNEVDRFAQSPDHNWRNPGFPQTERHPVTCVSRNDALAFCQWLSDQTGKRHRLPTEAQWEYACRAGSQTWYHFGDQPNDIYAHGNVADAALYAKHPEVVIRQRVVRLKPGQGDGQIYTAPVASFKPNGFGLYDMHGNVWEWTDDRYDEKRYQQLGKTVGREHGWQKQKAPIQDPKGPPPTDRHAFGDWRVIRGGSWYVSPISARAAMRAYAEGSEAYPYLGFRVIREVD